MEIEKVIRGGRTPFSNIAYLLKFREEKQSNEVKNKCHTLTCSNKSLKVYDTLLLYTYFKIIYETLLCLLPTSPESYPLQQTALTIISEPVDFQSVAAQHALIDVPHRQDQNLLHRPDLTLWCL